MDEKLILMELRPLRQHLKNLVKETIKITRFLKRIHPTTASGKFLNSNRTPVKSLYIFKTFLENYKN